MALWNLGSVMNEVVTIVDNVPTTLSGTNMLPLIDRQRQFINQYTGQDPGSVNIALKWQPPLVSLTVADVLGYMQLQGADVNRLQLGDLNIYKGTESSLTESMNFFKNKAMQELQIIGRKSHYFKANG